MATFEFIWHAKKAQNNLRKHKVSFEEAQTVFEDDDARIVSDPDHSQDEERFVLLGLSQARRILVVVHCYRSDDSVIRIISARQATKSEKTYYEEQAT